MLLIGMIFITFGCFGFNMGPVGRWNQQSAYIFLNTFLAIISGGLSWVLGAQFVPNSDRTERLLNGVIVGLVTSTAGIGYLTSIQVAVLTFIASICTFVLSQWVSDIIPIDDVVTSFGINGIGGFLGSLGVVLF
ncbi:ammonium transporter [Lactococcus garvieae]|nr:Ammonia channel precursor [Streptococcus parauberis]QQB44149.1 ammonium transporter [Lactococcus garvieae]CEF51700.1 Ammonia channel precursor [Lactococcus garvieae]